MLHQRALLLNWGLVRVSSAGIGISVLQRAGMKSAEKQRKSQGSEPQFDAAMFDAAKFDAVRFDPAPKGPVAELAVHSGLQRRYRHQCSAESMY